MKSPVLSLFHLLLVTFLMAGYFVEPLRAQVMADTSRYVTIEGMVRDQNDRKRLEFVHVTVPGTPIGTVTNSEGVFSIKIKRSLQARQILFTHVGYKNQRIPIDSLDQSGLKIYLTPTTQQLSDLIVRGGDARFIVEEAMQRVSSNYAQSATLQTGFYRETAQKRRRYISISEAVIDVYKTAYTQKNIEHDRVQVLKGRKLLSPKPGDTLVVKLLGGPTLPVFVDIAKNPDLVLDPLVMPCYAFEMQEITWLNERPHYVIRFYPQVVLSFALYEGLLYIDQERLSISRAEFNLDMSDLDKATEAILRKKPFGLRFKPMEVSFLVTYREHEGHFYINYVRNEIRFKCDWKRRLFSTTYTIVSEMVATDNRPATGNIPYKASFKSNHSLSDRVKDFADEEFWGDYNIIEPTESLENAVHKLKKQQERAAHR